MKSVSESGHEKRSVESFRSSYPELFCEKRLLEISQNSQENTCARDSDTDFSCGFYRIFKSTFFIEHLW